MSIEVICTPYGAAATERLGEQIAALKNGDPLAPVTVVVPTNIAGLAVRRALGGKGRGIAAVDFLKLFDLAERLGAPNIDPIRLNQFNGALQAEKMMPSDLR